MIVTYYACDLVSGAVLDTLPVSGEIAKTRGQVETVNWSLALEDERCPIEWFSATQPWRIMVVAAIGGYPGRLIQGWVIVDAPVGGPTVPIQAATLERLTETTYVRDGEWYSVDAAQVAAEIVNQIMVPEGGWIVEWTPTGKRIEVVHTTDSATTVNAALEALEADDGGPQWMTEVRWVPGEEGARVQKVVRVGPAPLGIERPDAIFDLAPGQYTRSRSWDGDRAALRVWGTTEGSGGQGITEQPYESERIGQGWHPKELFLSFTDMDEPQLNSRTRAALVRLADGTKAWDGSFQIDDAPALLDDWWIGDTVTYRAKPHKWDPIGGELVTPIEGWVLNPEQNTVTPRVLQEGDDE